MAENLIGFNEAGAEQYKKIAREVTRQMQNETPHRARWQQSRGGGGGSQRIWFVIREVECDIYTGAKILFVEVKEYTGGNCTSLVPGEDAYTGLTPVEDFCSTLSFFTAEQLLDGTGSATYFWPRGSGYCLPRWLVDDICVVPECA